MYACECFLDERIIPKDSDIYALHSGFQEKVLTKTPCYRMLNHYIIQYVLEGSGIYQINKTAYNLSRYDGFLIPPNVEVSLHNVSKQPWRFGLFSFDGKQVLSILEKSHLSTYNPVFHYEKDDTLNQCFINLYNEMRNVGEYSLSITGILYLIFGKISSSFKWEYPAPVDHFEQAKQYISRNLAKNLKVSDVAEHMKISCTHLYRIFKRELGLSPLQYIIDCKISEACALIKKTDLPLKEICFTLGFEYESHFFMQFKKTMGITPTEYRNHFLQRHKDNQYHLEKSVGLD
jgi:AraC-type DNA-binding domain-containing proteins